MATASDTVADNANLGGRSVTALVRAVDRWIYVFMAATFIVVTLTGFVPDAIEKVAAIKAGQRPPFPIVLHVHAILMASFLLLLLAQTTLMATGRDGLHQRIGQVAVLLVPAIVVVGFILVPTTYHVVWNMAQTAPPGTRDDLRQVILVLDDIALLQLRAGILFPFFIAIALAARRTDSALHKRMMILATAVPLLAATDRLDWLPSTFPTSPLGGDLYVLGLVSPMLLWDILRWRTIPRAYFIWIAVYLVVSIPVYILWNTQWWQSAVPHLMGV
jgi:hypothetical protein